MPAPRVVSLLPSATEVVALAGGADVLVGRSHECDYPDVSALPTLTAANNDFTSSAQMNDAVAMSLEAGKGLYSLNSDLLRKLRPDVIVTQDLCAVCAVDLAAVERATEGSANIVCLYPFSILDVLDDIRRVGRALGSEDRARAEADQLSRRIDAASKLAKQCAVGLPAAPKVCSWRCALCAARQELQIKLE